MKKYPKKAVVIGAGLGGISAAIRLSLKGYEVDVFEAAGKPGGKLNTLQLGKFRFDTGPSLFTMPEQVTELFKLANKDYEEYFQYHHLDIACRYFWEDGTIIDGYSDKDLLADELQKKLKLNPNSLKKFIVKAIRVFKLTYPVFLEKPFHKPWKINLWDALKATIFLPGMNIFQSMNTVNRRKLKHPKVIQLFNRMATYNGSNPYKAPGLLNIIAGLEHGSGAFFPVGGMYTIAQILVKLATESEVHFHYNTQVKRIIHEKGKVTGIEIGEELIPADIVVSNMDVVYAYRKLLPDLKEPKYLTRQERSSSALVFYWGMNKNFPGLDLHNIFFSNNYREEFAYLFEHLDIHNDPTVYVFISSKKNPADAPKGMENWFVMINAPHIAGQDWEKLVKTARKNILNKLSRILNTDLSDHIIEEEVLDPMRIESKTSSYKGSLYGASSNSKFSAFLRHPNYSRRVKGLFFTGGSVHPGGGIPLVLLSGKIISELC